MLHRSQLWTRQTCLPACRVQYQRTASALYGSEESRLSGAKADTLSYNALTQAIFKDAAEENARQQFNAKNELQVEEFFGELGSQVETANANRKRLWISSTRVKENAQTSV